MSAEAGASGTGNHRPFRFAQCRDQLPSASTRNCAICRFVHGPSGSRAPGQGGRRSRMVIEVPRASASQTNWPRTWAGIFRSQKRWTLVTLRSSGEASLAIAATVPRRGCTSGCPPRSRLPWGITAGTSSRRAAVAGRCRSPVIPRARPSRSTTTAFPQPSGASTRWLGPRPSVGRSRSAPCAPAAPPTPPPAAARRREAVKAEAGPSGAPTGASVLRRAASAGGRPPSGRRPRRTACRDPGATAPAGRHTPRSGSNISPSPGRHRNAQKHYQCKCVTPIIMRGDGRRGAGGVAGTRSTGKGPREWESGGWAREEEGGSAASALRVAEREDARGFGRTGPFQIRQDRGLDGDRCAWPKMVTLRVLGLDSVVP